ncbi:hypothetical protein AB0J28_19455 [Streptosporangium canum]|uniref:DUF7008 domain-containing protein n=1 Tax=Streptosporangium canum TaxID=324952 RepID=UPI0034220D37
MEQAQALATLTVDREQSHGWDARRLAPLLAGLREVLPWVRRWHDDFDPMYGSTLGQRRKRRRSVLRRLFRMADDAFMNRSLARS